MRAKERPVTTSISLEPSKLDRLMQKAFEKGYTSRNNLISFILTDWLEKDDKKKRA